MRKRVGVRVPQFKSDYQHMTDKIRSYLKRFPLTYRISYLGDVNAAKRLLHPRATHLTAAKTKSCALPGSRRRRNQSIDINTKPVLRLTPLKQVTIVGK